MDRPTEGQGERPRPADRPRLGPTGPARDTRRQYVLLALVAAALVVAGVVIGALSDDPAPQLVERSPAAATAPAVD